MRRSRLARGSDEFGICLLFAFSVLVLAPFEPHHVRPILAVLFAALLLFVLWTSAVPRAVLAVSVVPAVVSVGLVLANDIGASERAARLTFSVIAVVFLGCVVGTVIARISVHPRVTVQTTMGALTVYLLLGLLFCYLFILIALAQDRPFFAQRTAGTAVTFLYFSFASLTTVGYGDLTAADDLGRMAAVVEALIGQLYLVTIVALVVGNIGRSRRHDGDVDG